MVEKNSEENQVFEENEVDIHEITKEGDESHNEIKHKLEKENEIKIRHDLIINIEQEETLDKVVLEVNKEKISIPNKMDISQEITTNIGMIHEIEERLEETQIIPKKNEELKQSNLNIQETQLDIEENKTMSEPIQEIMDVVNQIFDENHPENSKTYKYSEERSEIDEKLIKASETTITEEFKKPEIHQALRSHDLEELISEIARLASLNQDLEAIPDYTLSIGGKGALNVITNFTDEKLYLDKTPNSDVLLIFRILFQLQGQELVTDNEKAWENCREFLLNLRSKDTHAQFLKNLISKFDFSQENLDKLEILLFNNQEKLNPQYFSSCPLTALFSFFLKEVLIFSGIIPGQTPAPRLYQRYIHKRNQIS